MTLYIILIEILKEFAKNFKCWRIGGGGTKFYYKLSMSAHGLSDGYLTLIS